MATPAPVGSSERMRRVRSTDTTPELLFREALSNSVLGSEIETIELPGKPDFVFPSRRIAIFIDGDLWHGGQWQLRGKLALEEQFSGSVSKEYWLSKIRRNMERDARVTNTLLVSGWTVLRFWESDITRNLGACIETTLRVVKKGAKPNRLSLLPQKTFAEFFAGVGLMRMGLEEQGWKAEVANDIEEQKFEMYSGHFQEDWVPFIVRDIHKLSASEIPAVSLATASF